MTRIDWVFYRDPEDVFLDLVLRRQLVPLFSRVCDRLGMTPAELLAAAQELYAQRGGE